MTEIYVSVDIEADGPIPGDNSMLSFGAAAFTDKGELIDTLTANLYPLPLRPPDPETAEFWSKNPEAWTALQVDQTDPHHAMQVFAGRLKDLEMAHHAQLVYVAYPVTFDFGFTHWYFHHFLGRDPFGFSGLDLKTYAMSLLGTTFKGATKRAMPKSWFKGLDKHTHVAIDDAIEQGRLFFKMRQYAKDLEEDRGVYS